MDIYAAGCTKQRNVMPPMKRIRTSYLAMVAVFVAMAFANASPAMAESFKSEWSIGAETLSERALKEEKFTISGGTINLNLSSGDKLSCKKTEGNGKVFQKGADELSLSLTSCELVKFPECSVGTPIKLEAKTQAYSSTDATVEALKESLLATVTLKGKCNSLPETNKLTGAVAAEVPGELRSEQSLTFSTSISETVNEELEAAEYEKISLTFGKLGASLEGKLTMKLTGANSGALWDDWLESRLCKVAPPPQNTCPATEFWPEATVIKLEKETSMKFEVGVATAQCTSAKIKGNLVAAVSAPLEATITPEFPVCNGCAVTALNTPYVSLLETLNLRNKEGWGKITIINLELQFVCGTTTCVYHTFDYGPNVIEANPGVVAKLLGTSGDLLTKVSGPGTCASTLQWKGTGFAESYEYKVEAPSPVYITR